MLKPNKLKSSGRNFAIKVEDVDKSFEIPEERIGSLKGYFLNPLKLFKQKNKKFEALSDINFTIKKGEFIGIIGRNGSGKSTLLKLIAGIYTPDRGRIKINGKLIPFLELGVGFNPELSAKENIFLNGAILGMSRKFLKLKMDEIIDFAEIREFIDTPIKNFSSGMVVRLAFSIAIQAKGDVYLLDEILSVGDVGFRSKSLKKMQELLRSGATVLYVSHDMATVEQLTDRAILLEKGRIVETGDPKKLVENYIASLLSGNEKLKFLKRNQKQKKGPSNDISAALTANDISYIVELSKDSGDGRAKITDVKIIDSSGEVTDDLIKGEKYKIVFEADIYDKIPNPLVHLGFRVTFGNEDHKDRRKQTANFI